MKLISAKVSNFRCIEDSEEFAITPITALVGKNESGKTSVLQALYKLKPSDPSDKGFNKELDYPNRHLQDFDERHPDGDAEVVFTRWQLDAADAEEIAKLIGQGVLTSETVTSNHYYSGKVTWSFDELNEEAYVNHLLQKAGCSTDEIDELSAHTVNELATKLAASATPSPTVQKVKVELESIKNNLHEAVAECLTKRMPTFLYFADYDKMKGRVSIDDMRKRKQSGYSREEQLFLAFLAYANTTLDEIANLATHETLFRKVDAASNKITDQIFEYWSQNPYLEVRFEIEQGLPGEEEQFRSGKIACTRVYNRLHRMTVSFDDRSAGFVWFFSFLVLFSQMRAKHGNVIVLLDEPGLSLHAKAQGDLLRFFEEKLLGKYELQTIYSTHSPFMVPKDSLAYVRTVEDELFHADAAVPGQLPIVNGTKVRGLESLLKADSDTLFPLRAALGYDISQSLFIGDNTLLVEGPSDILYLKTVSDILTSVNRRGLDPRWTICPSGGADKLQAFVSLFGGNKLNVAVLTDFAKGTKSKIELLRHSGLLDKEKLFTTVDFVNQSEADVEDFFGAELYLQIVNAALGLAGKEAITSAMLPTAGERIVKKVEEVIRLRPEVPEFNHYTPALWLLQNRELLESESSASIQALDCFERVFDRLNSVLPLRIEKEHTSRPGAQKPLPSLKKERPIEKAFRA